MNRLQAMMLEGLSITGTLGLPDCAAVLRRGRCGEVNYWRGDGSAWRYCPSCGREVIE